MEGPAETALSDLCALSPEILSQFPETIHGNLRKLDSHAGRVTSYYFAFDFDDRRAFQERSYGEAASAFRAYRKDVGADDVDPFHAEVFGPTAYLHVFIRDVGPQLDDDSGIFPLFIFFHPREFSSFVLLSHAETFRGSF